MKWLKSAINGEVSLVKTFWPGAIGYVILNLFYLLVSGAVITEQEKFLNAAVNSLTTRQMLTPPLLLLAMSFVLGLYTTLAAASIWQAADKYPVKVWAFWPNLSYLAVLLSLGLTSAEIMFSLPQSIQTIIQILALGDM